MKKNLLFVAFVAASMLFTTSCSNDELVGVESGNEATVSFSLGVENGVGSRAISDGLKAKKLVYALYNAEGNLIKTIKDADANGQFVDTEAFKGGLNHKVYVTLAKGQTYTAVFWAQSNACEAYTTTDLKNVTVTYGAALNNDENRDAFFAAKEFKVTGHEEIDVTLKRPFAQINLGVTDEDWDAAVASEIDIETSKVVIKNAATQINLLNGEVNGLTEVEVTYDFAATPKSSNEVLKVDLNKDGTAEDYHYLSMSYILVGAQKETLDDLDFTFHPTSGNDIVFDMGLNHVPVQRNWRTNIIGQILTGNITFDITIDPIYDGEYNGNENGNFNGYGVELHGKYYATIEAALANAVSGDEIHLSAGEYTLPGSIKLKDNATGTITFAGTGEKTVVAGSANASGMNIIMKDLKWTSPSTGYDTAFIHATSVSFENCNITGQYYAQSLAPHTFTDCTIDPQTGYLYTYGANCTFENCTFNSSKGKALQIYTDGTTGESTVNINDCTFKAEQSATTWQGYPVTAIDINSFANDQGTGHKFNVNINNTTATGYGIGLYSGSSLWNIKGGEENVTVTIDGKKVNDAVDVDGVKYGTIAAALANVTDGAVITLTEGTYIIPETAKSKTLSFVGTGDPAKTVIECGKGSYALYGSTVTFDNLTIETANGDYQGFYHIAAATYKNCIIKNMYTLYGPSEFTECTFSVSGDKYNVWTYGTNPTFTDCTFYCDGKAVLVYTENNEIDDVVTFNSCTFNDKGGLINETKAAIEAAANTATVKHTLIINTCTVNGFAVTKENATTHGGTNLGTNVWGNKNLMTAENLTVKIDGTEVY